MKSTAQGHSQMAKPNSSEKFLGRGGTDLPTISAAMSMRKSLVCPVGARTVPPGGIIFSGHLNLSCLVADTFSYN